MSGILPVLAAKPARFAHPSVNQSRLFPHAPLGQPAIYARGVIPLGDPVMHTGEASGLTWRVFTPGTGALYEDAGDGYGPSCRRTAHVESGADGRVRFSLSVREGEFVPARGLVRVQLGSEVIEVPESGEAVVIERLVDL